MERSDRERTAYDDGNVYEANDALKGRFSAVFACPNTLRAERQFNHEIYAEVAGKSVLDVGCGAGELSRALDAAGAAYVRGIDISSRFVAEALPHARPGELEFEVADVSLPITGQFDLVVGRAILHHLDWQDVLTRLYRDNLAPGGKLVFYEPLGSSWLMVLYWRFFTAVHTPDERPFYRADLRLLRQRFPGFRMHGVNYASLPLGLICSLLRQPADGPLMRWADRLDAWIDARLPVLQPDFRQAIFVIDKV